MLNAAPHPTSTIPDSAKAHGTRPCAAVVILLVNIRPFPFPSYGHPQYIEMPSSIAAKKLYYDFAGSQVPPALMLTKRKCSSDSCCRVSTPSYRSIRDPNRDFDLLMQPLQGKDTFLPCDARRLRHVLADAHFLSAGLASGGERCVLRLRSVTRRACPQGLLADGETTGRWLVRRNALCAVAP